MLTLPIKRTWYDMILSGEKKEEYRDVKPYYEVRLQNLFGVILLERNGEISEIMTDVPEEIKREPVQEIIFRAGYSATAPKIKCKCTLTLGEGRPEWGAAPGKRYFVLGIKEVEEM